MSRGRLRVYLGAAPGVGKTYEMLLEGHRRVAQGDDCVVGFVEPHGRPATAVLVQGLEVVPRLVVPHRGGSLEDMDLDAVLSRRPGVALVDELAHTNAPGLRHEKRWQDVEDLLDAGIDVITTLNVQHLQSLNDAVAEMTGVRQRETIPDEVARRADEIELVDLSPEAIRRRMVAGAIYPPNRIDAALSHYFRPGNLTALRELALLWLADRVDEGLRRYRQEHGIAAPWEARERIVVGVSAGPESERLIRRAARLASRIPGSDLLAVYVARSDGRLGADAGSLAHCRGLVEELGGTWHEVVGADVAEALGQFARHENATQLVVGASRGLGARAFLTGTERVARRVTRLGGMLDVHVLMDERPAGKPLLRFPELRGVSRRRRLIGACVVVLGVPVLTVVLTQLRSHLSLASDLLLYLLMVVVSGAVGGLYPALAGAVVCAAAADYYFTPPFHSFDVATGNDAVALVVFVGAGVMVSWAAELSSRRQSLASRAAAEARAVTTLADAALRGDTGVPYLLELVREIFGLDAVSLLDRSEQAPAGEVTGWSVLASSGEQPPEALEGASIAAPGEPSPTVLVGRGPVLAPPDRQVFSACAALMVEAVRHRQLAEEAAIAEAHASEESRQRALVVGAARILGRRADLAKRAVADLVESASLPAGSSEKLAVVQDEVGRVGLAVEQLADVARARAGALDIHFRPTDVTEVVAAGLDALGPDRHRLDVDVPTGLPDVITDAAVLARLVTILAANALRRTSGGSIPTLTASMSQGRVDLCFEDRGAALDLRPGSDGVAVGIAEVLAETINAMVRTEERPDGGHRVVVSVPGIARPATG